MGQKCLVKTINCLFTKNFKKITLGLVMMIFLFKFHACVLIIELLIKNLYWSFQIRTGNIDKTYSVKYYRNPNNEWELLDNNIFISRKLSFYYIDDGLINTIVFSRNNLLSNFICLIHATGSKNTKSVLLKSVELVQLESSWKFNVSSYKLKIQFKISTDAAIKKNLKFEMYFIYETLYTKFLALKRERTRRPIVLKVIRNKNNSDINKIALCGPMLYLDLNSHNSLKEWIEFNIRIGYQRIILYVILLGAREKYKKLFLQYSDVVEVRQFNYIPNVNYEDTSSYYHDPILYVKYVKYHRLHDINDDWDTHFVYHRGLMNGCFLSCFKDYHRVTVIDNDELIYPNSGQVNYLFHDKDQVNPQITTQNLNEQLKHFRCQNNINKYIDELNLVYFNQSDVSNISLWMHYGHYINASLVKQIFYHFKIKLFNMISFNTSFDISIHHKRNISFSVTDQTDFIYLKNLVYFFDNSYLNGESLIKLENNYYKRIWMIQESEKRQLGWGKVNTK